MEKQQKQHTTYNSISKREAQLLGTMREADIPVFGIREIRARTNWGDTRIHNTLQSLVTKRHLTRLKRNSYTFQYLINERLFEIATETIKPSYISFWTALSYHGLTEQQVRTVQLVSTKQAEDIRLSNHGIEISSFKPSRFFGYGRHEGFVLAEMEKALIDSLYLPEKCGGLEEFAKALKRSWEYLDADKLAEYALRFGSRSLVSRLGYILEILGLCDERMIKRFASGISKGYVKLVPGKQNVSGYNETWKVMVNHDIGRTGDNIVLNSISEEV